jgi:hypothetical protein
VQAPSFAPYCELGAFEKRKDGIMKYNRENAYKNGIFIQQSSNQKRRKDWCVTFPIIDNTGNTCIFPSEYFKTFSQALTWARQYKSSDSRCKTLPIWANQCLWRGCRGIRHYSLIQTK